ncbi:MAG TPA: hypothetical protein VGP72_14195 [Planctomycetota bacterium]|jgi:hypothetical protein
MDEPWGKLSVAQLGVLIVGIAGMLSFTNGPAQNTPQFVFRISALALGLSLCAIGAAQTSKLPARTKTLVYLGTPTFAAACVATLGVGYYRGHVKPEATVPVSGTISGEMYVNQQLGFSLPLIKGWHTSAEESERRQNGDPKRILLVSPQEVDLTKRESVGFKVETVWAPSETPEQLLKSNEDRIRKLGMALYLSSDIKKASIDGVEFCSATYRSDAGKLSCDISACVRHDVALLFYCTYETDDDRAKLTSMVKGITFQKR